MRSTRRLRGLVMITLYLSVMTIAVFAASYIVAHAEDDSAVEVEETKAWFEIDDNTLIVYLEDDSTEDEWEWKYSISDESLMKMAWSANTGNDGYVAAFRPTGAGSGNVVISYKLLKSYDESPIDNKIIKVDIDKDQHMHVTAED